MSSAFRWNPTRYRLPDVVVWSRELPKESILTKPPIAVFEVLSPEDSISRLLIKLDDYEMMGVQNIFVVDPKTGRTYKYVGGDLRLCTAHMPLDGAVGHVQWEEISSLETSHIDTYRTSTPQDNRFRSSKSLEAQRGLRHMISHT